MDGTPESVGMASEATNALEEPVEAAPTPRTGDIEDAIEAGWEVLLKAWEDPEAHRKFIGLATGLGALPRAGARYREVQKAHPERAERAQAGIDKILSVALSQMDLARTPSRPPPRLALFLLALFVSAGLVGAALWAYVGG